MTAPEEVSSAMDGDEPVAGHAVADILNLGFDAHLRELPQRPALSLASAAALLAGPRLTPKKHIWFYSAGEWEEFILEWAGLLPLARFTLLREQYDSDLSRLEMVQEVGDLLGYFDRGVCVFCGAAVEDQHPPSGHVISEITELAEAVNAEREKTIGLREDLNVTLADVAGQRTEIQASLQRWQDAHDQLDSALATAEQELAPKDQALSELLTQRSNVERQIATHEQIERLEHLRGDFVFDEEPPESQGRDVSTHQLASLGAIIASMLTAWGVPDSTTVDFDLDTYDLIVTGQARSSRGKGIRAIFHAAYNLALALHCRAIHQAHPGFVVLDSPLITYRGPETKVAADSEDDFVSQTVADAFFRYLASNSNGQVIILENTDPPLT